MLGEPYRFPAQKDRCATCARPLDLRDAGEVWKTRALPWLFCSQACIGHYLGKDASAQAPSKVESTANTENPPKTRA